VIIGQREEVRRGGACDPSVTCAAHGDRASEKTKEFTVKAPGGAGGASHPGNKHVLLFRPVEWTDGRTTLGLAELHRGQSK